MKFLKGQQELCPVLSTGTEQKINIRQPHANMSGSMIQKPLSWYSVHKAASMCIEWIFGKNKNYLINLYFEYIDNGKLEPIGAGDNTITIGNIYWRENTIYHAFEKYLNKNHDIELLKRIVEGDEDVHQPISELIEKLKKMPEYERGKAIHNTLVTLANKDSIMIGFFALECYLNDIRSTFMEKLMSSYTNSKLNERIYMTEYYFKLEGSFSDDPMVVKNAKRLLKLCDDYSESVYGCSTYDAVCQIIIYGNYLGHFESGSLTDKMLPSHSASSNAVELAGAIINHIYDEDYMKLHVRTAINNVCASYIEYYYEAVHRQKYKAIGCSIFPSVSPIDASSILDADNALNLKSSDINYMIRQTPPSDIFLSILWETQLLLVVTAEGREKMHLFKNEMQNSTTLLNQKNIEIQTLQNKILDMESKIHHDEQRIAEFEDLFEKQTLAVAESEAVSSCQLQMSQMEREYMAKIKKLERELDDTKHSLEKECERNQYLLIKQQTIIPSVIQRKADINKKYIFVVVNDSMKTKLLNWFPNSIVSDGREISLSGNHYMAVFITKNLSHSEYDRVKSICINHQIPIANCNAVNFDRICQSILDCEDEYKLV